MAVIFTEEYPEAKASFSLEISRVLFSEKSPFQKIEILESPFFGKILVIDDCIMLTEKDEFIYHEMIAHVPLHVHSHPSKVLVIGGGDDGLLTNQAESPFYTRKWLLQVSQKLGQVFSQMFFYQANIPTYPSGYWLFGFASKKYHPSKDFLQNKYDEQKLALKYYNQEIHYASFMLPNFVKDIIHAK